MNERLERTAYLDERRSLIDAEIDQSRLFDRAILVLSSGALGLSLTFIDKAVPNIDGDTLRWLKTGWVFFIGSLLSTLVSFQVSQAALKRQRDIIDYLYSLPAEDKENSTETTNKFAKRTFRLNISALLLFVAGTISLTVFVALNTPGGG
jgi:hypothetical protein